MVGDANYPERNFLGPLQSLEGAGTVTVGANPILPIFQLADGQNWAEFVIQVRLMYLDPVRAGRALDEARAAAGSNKKVPRPPNPFIIYRSERHPAVAAANPGMPNKQICKSPHATFPLSRSSINYMEPDSNFSSQNLGTAVAE